MRGRESRGEINSKDRMRGIQYEKERLIAKGGRERVCKDIGREREERQ